MKNVYFESTHCPNHLTSEELKARDIMINAFNPVLKILLCEANPEEWERYGYNSCRQTAIFGAVLLKELLPSYDIMPYEASFVDREPDGSTTPYVHCYISAINKKKHRDLVIDLSRTHKRLIFNEATLFVYPLYEEYTNTMLLSKEPIDLDTMYYNTGKDFCEYFTQRSPKDVMKDIKRKMAVFYALPEDKQELIKNMVYTAYTHLLP